MKHLFPLIMSVVFLTVLVTSNIYLSRRFSWAFSVDNITILHIVFAAIPVLMITGLIGFSNATSTVGSFIYVVAAVLTGMMLYLLLTALLVDLVRLFVSMKPFTYGLIVLGMTLLVSGYGILNATRIKVNEVKLVINHLDKQVKLAHLSDIHLGHFRGKVHFEKLIARAMEMNPDILVITGDLFDGRRQMNNETLEPLKDLDVPVFFVEGNHDRYSGPKEIKQMLRLAGVNVLENRIMLQDGLQIVGLNHMKADKDTESIPPNPSSESIEEVLEKMEISKDKPAILLHHSPDGMKHAHANGIDLYLAGHTHAGQLFPMNYLNDLLFKYNRGLSNFNGTQIYVSRGSGTFGPPMRVGTVGEISIITLVRK